MVALTINCLGQFTVLVGQTPLVSFRTDKVRALLAYLALEARPHRREALSALLWPDIGDEYAQKNLRNTLSRLRQPLQNLDAALAEKVLLTTRQTIALNPEYLIADVQQFEALIRASAAHARSESVAREEHIAHCADCLARLVHASEIYQGELLAGFTLADAPGFEEWLAVRREALHQQMVLLLYDLAVAHETQGERALAQQDCRRLLALEPWREEAHRFLIRLLAQNGQRSAALAQYEQCRLALEHEFGIEPAAETKVLYEQIRRGDFDAPPLPPAQSAAHVQDAWQAGKRDEWQGNKSKRAEDPPVIASSPNNLPVDLTPFVGRTRSIAEVRARLAQGARLLTLVGSGGMGKTRLAMEVGRQELATYGDGVIFVPLAALNAPTALAGAIVTVLSTTLDVALQGSDPQTTLVQFLRQRHLLLILDNFEHLMVGSSEAVELLNVLLQSAPRLQLIVTSRERLQLRSEQLFQVQPLSTTVQATLAEASVNSAVRLFVQSAQFVQGDFQLTSSNLAAILRICQLVEGMPLGLELAAAQVGVLALHAIADAIAQSATFLAVEWHDLPARQRSLRAVFSWSWQLLSAAEQAALRQMSIFQGGADRTAAEAVTGVTFPLLRTLCHKSLMQVQESAAGEVRYTMHELVRQFAAEELHAAGEAPAVAMQHCRYYLDYLAARGLRLGRQEPKEASAEIQAELDNIRLAWQWAATHGCLEELDQASYSWWIFCSLQAMDAEARSTFAQAIYGVRQQLAALPKETDRYSTDQRLLAKLLAIHADLLFAKGHDEEMAAQAQEAIELGAAIGGVEGEALGTFVLGRVAQDAEQRRQAGDLWRRAIQLVSAYLSTHPESELLHEVNWMAHSWLRGNALGFGDYTNSRAYSIHAHQICQELGKRRGELFCLIDLAQLHFLLFDVAAAEVGYAAALDMARSVNYLRMEMRALAGMAEVMRLRGHYTTARTLLEQAHAAVLVVAARYDETLILASLIRLHEQIGNHAAATQYNEQLTQILAHIKLPRECQLYAHLAAAIMAQNAGDIHRAHLYAEQASQLNEQDGEILFRRVDTALILGHARAAVGQWQAAATAFHLALDAFQQFDNQTLAAEPRAGLAQIALAQGDLARALAQVEAILPVLQQEAHAGFNNPAFIYLTCYRALVANRDNRAPALLQQGYDLLQEEAAALDAEERQRFFTAVPLHHALLTAYAELSQIPTTR